MTDVVRTRFAPSPTGYLHIGGARTALFNWLLARRLGGKFILRIEDTDQTRNIERADEKLMEDLRWLGLQWDEGPGVGGVTESYHQSRRVEVYRQRARQLLDAGQAYYAFDTREELDAMRKGAQREKRAFRYPRPARFPSESDAQKARDEGRPVVVRLRMPSHDFEVNDVILGKVRIAERELDDFVCLKSDGWPTYHFAVVIDDFDMRVTHVLRGQEHLMNTPNHMAIQEHLGYPTPVYAHLPIIMNMDGTKMSKREKDRAVRAALDARLRAGTLDVDVARGLAGGVDPAAFEAWMSGDTQLEGDALHRLARALDVHMPEIQVHDFRVSGYLPEVVLNFIALLGWSPGNDLEKMTPSQMCELFSLERIGKTNARFDRTKLLNFNTTAIAAARVGDFERLAAAFDDYLRVNPDSPLARLEAGMRRRLVELNDGIRTLSDIDEKCGAMFVADDALRYDERAVQKVLLKDEGAGLKRLEAVEKVLAGVEIWSAEALQRAVESHAAAGGLKMGEVAQPIRVALTGTTVSLGIFVTLELVGRERALRRIAAARRRFGAQARNDEC